MVIIGSGNVAFHMAKAFKNAGIEVIQIFGRNKKALIDISTQTGIAWSNTHLEKAEFYLICVSDDSIERVSELIEYQDVLVAHTSGSMSSEILKGKYEKAGFYPLQTFSRNHELNYSEIPFLIECKDEKDRRILYEIGLKVSSRVQFVDFKQKQRIHLAAVFANNFVNHLYTQAQQICKENQIPFELLHPLILETAKKILTTPPEEAQTGPARRNDSEVIKSEEDLIPDVVQLGIYKTLTKSIIKMYE